MANVGVIGAGSWGTALSVLLADNGHHVTIWSIDEKEVEMLDKKRELSCTCSSVAVYKGNCEEDVSLRRERSDYR